MQKGLSFDIKPRETEKQQRQEEAPEAAQLQAKHVAYLCQRGHPALLVKEHESAQYGG